MKAYLDSTPRHLAWKDAFGGIRDCFSISGEYSEEISHIFLHQSDLRHEANDDQYCQDLVAILHDERDLEGNAAHEAALRAVALRTHLRSIKNKPNPPWLIIYSGGPLNEESRAEESRKLSTLMDGYPMGRIRAIEEQIPRDIVNHKDALKKIINDFVASLSKREFEDPNVVRAKERMRMEGRLALRLLCEAWEMNNRAEPIGQNKIAITSPVTPMQWFNPFGKSVSNESAEDIAANLVSLDVSADVKTFLLDIAKLKSVPPEGVRKLAKMLGVAAKTI